MKCFFFSCSFSFTFSSPKQARPPARSDTDKRFREMQFIKDIERDIRDICVQDGRWQNAIIPLSFDVGLQHALKPTKTPEDDDITAPIDIFDEDMMVAPMEALDRVTPMHPRR